MKAGEQVIIDVTCSATPLASSGWV